METFKKHLENIGVDPNYYLNKARKAGKENGYDPSKINFTDDGIHKLEITTPEGKKIKYGRNKYGDFILWGIFEKEGLVPKGYSEMKRRVFRSSHGKMQEILEKRKGKKLPFSANELAIKILW
jgi:hypothetical protein